MKRRYSNINQGEKGKNPENEPISHEQWLKDLSSRLEEDRARNQERKASLENPKEEPSRMNEDRIAVIYNLLCDRVPFEHIENIMGVPEGKVEYAEFERVMTEAALLIQKEEAWAGVNTGQPQTQANEEDFQDYDPVEWEMAASGTKGDFTIYDEEAQNPGGAPTNSPIPENWAPASEAEFVRALRNCRQGSKPYYQKGDILRVINKARRSGLSHDQFEVLPLKPPGEAGIVRNRDFEPADLAEAEEVGRELRNDKEADSYRCAMEWED